MKIFKILFLSTLLFATSCSSDNNNDDNTTADLIGDWTGTAVDYTGTSVTEGGGVSITSTFVGTGYDVNYVLTFSENPNEMTADGTYSIELETTIQGQTTTQNFENLQFDTVGEWTRDGNVLTITQNGETQEAVITELTDTNLTLEMDSEVIQQQSGFTITTTTHVIAKYTR